MEKQQEESVLTPVDGKQSAPGWPGKGTEHRQQPMPNHGAVV